MAGISEERLQQEIFTFHWNNYHQERKLLFMVHNSPKNKIDGARLKAKGMVSGVSDLIYLNPRIRRPQFLEVKTEEGIQSDNQKEWERIVVLQGYDYHLIRSLNQAKKVCGW
jgi:hypothetical protein